MHFFVVVIANKNRWYINWENWKKKNQNNFRDLHKVCAVVCWLNNKSYGTYYLKWYSYAILMQSIELQSQMNDMTITSSLSWSLYRLQMLELEISSLIANWVNSKNKNEIWKLCRWTRRINRWRTNNTNPISDIEILLKIKCYSFQKSNWL